MLARTLLTVALVIGGVTPTSADEVPLHERIDRLIDARVGEWTIGETASDAEFLRRVSLDLAGRIPTTAEAHAFLEDSAADKRSKLIDRLLAGSDYPRRMREVFESMLLERRGTHEEWSRFLRTAFEENRPWDELVRDVLAPNADDEDRRGAAYFLTVRLTKEGAMAAVDVPALTRDVGRLFAGIDLKCAQCHDHLTIDDYEQRDFQGLHVVFENLQSRRDVKFPAVAEKLMTAPKEFSSVFDQVPMTTGPVVPGGDEITIPTFAKGEEYAVPPDRKTRQPGVPKFSPLREVAAGLTSARNELFARNAVNRLWFVMLGRGLVEPLDLQHAANPPSHPELLTLLADEFARHDFDVKWLLREIALTRTYQRSSVLPDGKPAPPANSYAVGLEKRMLPEQLFWSLVVASGDDERLRTTTADGRSKTIEQLVATDERLVEMRKLFVDHFANAPKEPEVDFAPTVKGSLFVMNDERFLAMFDDRDGNRVAGLAAQDDADAVIDELYLAVFTREPTPGERSALADHLAKHTEDRAATLGHIVWAMTASTEFVVNH